MGARWTWKSGASIGLATVCMAPTAVMILFFLGALLFNVVGLVAGVATAGGEGLLVFLYTLMVSWIAAFFSAPVIALGSIVMHPVGIVAAPSAFGEDADGEIYVADIATGTIYRLAAVLAPGDVDGDGDVDRDDLVPIALALGTPADGSDDRRDLDRNGFITRRDFWLAVRSCDRPQCATE